MSLKLSLQTSTTTTSLPHNHRHNHHFTLPTTLLRRTNRRKFTTRLSLSSGASKTSTASDELQSETLKTLEWDRLCNQLSSFTSTSMGLHAAQSGSIPVGRTVEESRKLLSQTSAALGLPRKLDFTGAEDVSGIVEVAAAGEALSKGELCAVGRTLRAARRLKEKLEEICEEGGGNGRIEALLEILRNCNFLVELERKIEFCIDCTLSIVLDRASDDLAFIRSERRKNMDALDSLLRSIAQKVFQAGGIDKALVTNRRSRMCVGVKASHRSLLPGGIVLNVSSSGATYFMEPKEAVDLNNMEVMLSNSEKDEEQAILSLLASELGNSAADVIDILNRIKEVDLAIARAGHAQWLNAVCPTLNPVTRDNALLVDIEGVQHPLLLEQSLGSLSNLPRPNIGSSEHLDGKASTISFRELPNEVRKFPVPINIKVGCGTSVVIISGPNAGGKTASMKTLGLMSLMAKAGFYLPAKSLPKLPWFDLILADIGDHQSLEQSLSTFSGHILRIGKILEVASKYSLVLIDEIGSGTDPSEGVALSASILQYLKDRVSLAVVTTHYADLSRLQDSDARFGNAAMEFSMETLQPTYQVLWGCAGESNALRIARKIGFDNKIIDRAENWLERLMPEKQAQLKGQLYQSLLEERNKMENRARQAASLHSDVMDLYDEIEGETQDLDVRQKALIAKETQQVEQELLLVKSQLENVVMEFENQLKITDVNEYGSILRKAEAVIESLVASHSPMHSKVSKKIEGVHTPQPGEQVHVKHLRGKVATVVEVSEDDGSVLIQSGKVKFRVDKSGIQAMNKGAISSQPFVKKKARISGNLKILGERKAAEPSYGPMIQTSKNTLDLRGTRVEEASGKLNMAIAERGPYSLLFIVHGMGTGAVKECVIDILKNHPRITKFDQESPMNYGCTIAFIK